MNVICQKNQTKALFNNVTLFIGEEPINHISQTLKKYKYVQQI